MILKIHCCTLKGSCFVLFFLPLYSDLFHLTVELIKCCCKYFTCQDSVLSSFRLLVTHYPALTKQKVFFFVFVNLPDIFALTVTHPAMFKQTPNLHPYVSVQRRLKCVVAVKYFVCIWFSKGN